MKNSEKGLALIITLLVTALLTAIIVDFSYRVYLSTARAEIFRDSWRAGLLARNGVELARLGLEELLKRKPAPVASELVFPAIAVDDDSSIEIRAIDESSKVSIQTTYPKTGADNRGRGETFGRLLGSLEIDESLKDALADWIDNDDIARGRGAEWADHYRNLERPYRPKNNRLDAIEELLSIKGFTPEVFEKIEPFVTAHNASGLVNINTAPKDVLAALSEEMTPELAARLVEQRERARFRDRSEIIGIPGFERVGYGLQGSITVSPGVFTVIVTAKVNDSVRQARAVIDIDKGVMYWRED